MKIGRPRYADLDPVWYDRVRKALEVKGSAKQAAKLLGVDHHTIITYARELKIPVGMPGLQRNRMPNPPAKGNRHSCLYKWMWANPGRQLPPSCKEIAKITGCSIDAVKSYYKRRRKEMNTFLRRLPLLTRFAISFITDEREYVTTAMFASYVYRYDRWNFSITIRAVLETGEHVEITFVDAYELWRTIVDQGEQERR